MSWLNDISKVIDPLGSKIHEQSSFARKIDPLGTAVYGGGTKPAAAVTTNTPGASGTVAGGGYYGNPSDPQWGSFSKPFSIQDFYSNLDPGYLFRMQQGSQGLMNSAAAGNGALSGAALKDLADYNQMAASDEYGNAFNRYQTSQGNIFSRLAQLAGLGQASASGTAANGVALAGNAGQALQNAGSAAGAGIVGGANAINSGLTNYAALRQWRGGAGNDPLWSQTQGRYIAP